MDASHRAWQFLRNGMTWRKFAASRSTAGSGPHPRSIPCSEASLTLEANQEHMAQTVIETFVVPTMCLAIVTVLCRCDGTRRSCVSHSAQVQVALCRLSSSVWISQAVISPRRVHDEDPHGARVFFYHHRRTCDSARFAGKLVLRCSGMMPRYRAPLKFRTRQDRRTSMPFSGLSAKLHRHRCQQNPQNASFQNVIE